MKTPAEHPEFPAFATVQFVSIGGNDFRMVPGAPITGWLDTEMVLDLLQINDSQTLTEMCESGVFLGGEDWRWKNAEGRGGHRLWNPHSVASFRVHGRSWRRRLAAEKNTRQLKLAGRKAA